MSNPPTSELGVSDTTGTGPARGRQRPATVRDATFDVLRRLELTTLFANPGSTEVPAILVEEAPSSRPELHARIPARSPLGFVSAAMGGLGFALPGAAGLRMALPDRPVVAVVGDGSALYSIQSLWSAARYGAGALFIVLANGGYAVMDRLAEQHGGIGPWPSFHVDVTGLARSFGCPARRVETFDETIRTLDDVVPGLAERDEPLLLEVAVAPDAAFAP